MNQEYRENVLQLIEQKDKIEDDIKTLTTILTNNGVGLSDPLVDAEGFPLNHIDIYQVRHARQQIICLQNDHKNIMKQIEHGLQGYYNSPMDTANTHIRNNDNNAFVRPPVQYKNPFARITVVSPGSPAAYAGLEVGDLVVEFGSLNASNFTSIMDVSNIVRHSEGHQLNLKLKRGDHYTVTHLIPKIWSGRGLLGCNIVALN